FDRLFDVYWRTGGNPPPVAEAAGARQQARTDARRGHGLQVRVQPLSARQPEGDSPEAAAGTADLLTAKDFAGYTADDSARARALVRRLAPKLATARARRTRVARRGDDVDLRRSL